MITALLVMPHDPADRRSRIMAKWGFAGEGSGLGRAQQGAPEPIRAVQRPRNRGLGAE